MGRGTGIVSFLVLFATPPMLNVSVQKVLLGFSTFFLYEFSASMCCSDIRLGSIQVHTAAEKTAQLGVCVFEPMPELFFHGEPLGCLK